MTSPVPASSAPTVREAVAAYVEHLTPGTTADKLQVLGAALHALLEPAMEEPVTAITPLRLVLLGGELKAKTSPKTSRPLAVSTFRRYVLAAQEFYAWASARWPRQVERGPSAPAATQEPGSKQHLGELIRLLRTDAGLTRVQLGETTRLGAIVVKRVELGQQRLTRRQLDLLLNAPAMAGLLDWAEREGVPVELAGEDVGDVPGEGGAQ